MLILDPAQEIGRDFLVSVAPYSGGDHLLADVPGLGKTAQAITAANSIPWIQDILVVVPAIARVNWQREWARWSPGREVTVVHKLADCPARPRGVLIVSANALSIDTKHGKRLRRILNGKVWDLAIVDECFVAGTKIATPSGPRSIETLRPGDRVLNAVGEGVVRDCSSKRAESLVTVYFALGEKVTCTPDHPFLTGAGWKRAVELAEGDEVITHDESVRILRDGHRAQSEKSTFLQSVLLGEVEGSIRESGAMDAGTPGQNRGRVTGRAPEEPRVGCRVEPAANREQSHVGRKHQAESGLDSPIDGPQARCEGWQRNGADHAASAPVRGADRPRAGDGTGRKNGRLWGDRRTQSLQSRRCTPNATTSNRSGWCQPQPHVSQGPRSEKGEGAGSLGVARVEVHEPGDLGGHGWREVYNLEVSGHPSYVLANGAVVHNCHYFKDIKSRRTRGLYGQNAAGEKCVIAKAVRRWMLTGTPMPNHPGELWPMFRAIWPHLIRAGHGGPMTYEEFILTYCQVKKNEMGELVPIGVKSPAQLRALLDMVMLRRTVVDGLPPLIWQDEPFLVECGTRELARLERHPEFQDMSNVLAAIESTSQGLEGLEDDYLHMATLRRLTGRLKAKAAAEYIDYVLQHDTKAVILAVHREVIEVLEEELAHLNPAVVHGGKTNRQQVEAIDRLNNDPTCRVAIGQIETVKTAINMQAATEVIFVEQQFTPSDNSQAVARAHRRGQKYPVNVSVLAIAGSFDEVIQRVLARKSKAINSVLEN